MREGQDNYEVMNTKGGLKIVSENKLKGGIGQVVLYEMNCSISSTQ